MDFKRPTNSTRRRHGDRRWRAVVLAVGLTVGSTLAIGQNPTLADGPSAPEPGPGRDGFRVAFFADTGFADVDPSALGAYTDRSIPLPARVLMLVRAEGADLALHGGDMGYTERGKAIPEKWDRMTTQILGADYPLFASGGNHDQKHWSSAPPDDDLAGLGYRDVLRRRYEAVTASPFGEGLDCSFATDIDDIGQRMSCTYQDTLTFVTVGLGDGNGIPPTALGQPDNEYESYLRTALAASTTPWTVCNWHFNQTLFQTGSKPNQAGWKPYEYCREAGALIATGHEHSYARTHLMSRFWSGASVVDIASRATDLVIDETRTIAWVSGMGGRGPRKESAQGKHPWWAAKVNATNQPRSDGAGVLFCDFSTSNDAHAECYFKTVDGAVRDRFRLVSNANGASGTFGGGVPRGSCAGKRATIVGTMHDDVLEGTDGDDVIAGLAGDDTLYGFGGDDLICGGGGADTVMGGDGADQLRGDSGADSLSGEDGADRIIGAQGADQIWGGPDNDSVSAGSDPDVVDGGPGADVLSGDAGSDVIKGGAGPDQISGGRGVDDCDGGPGRDTAKACETIKSAP